MIADTNGLIYTAQSGTPGVALITVATSPLAKAIYKPWATYSGSPDVEYQLAIGGAGTNFYTPPTANDPFPSLYANGNIRAAGRFISNGRVVGISEYSTNSTINTLTDGQIIMLSGAGGTTISLPAGADGLCITLRSISAGVWTVAGASTLIFAIGASGSGSTTIAAYKAKTFVYRPSGGSWYQIY
jgi:hypothetical protein